MSKSERGIQNFKNKQALEHRFEFQELEEAEKRKRGKKAWAKSFFLLKKYFHWVANCKRHLNKGCDANFKKCMKKQVKKKLTTTQMFTQFFNCHFSRLSNKRNHYMINRLDNSAKYKMQGWKMEQLPKQFLFCSKMMFYLANYLFTWQLTNCKSSFGHQMQTGWQFL